MQRETKRRMGYFITYFAAAVILFLMYATKQTPVGLLGGIICVFAGIKNLMEFLHLRKREQDGN